MKITFSEIRKKRIEKKNNQIFNLLKIRNDINGYKREIKHFRSSKKKNLKNINKENQINTVMKTKGIPTKLLK